MRRISIGALCRLLLDAARPSRGRPSPPCRESSVETVAHAFDPQFAKNRFLYVACTYRSGAFTLRKRLARLHEDTRTPEQNRM
jgi:hypothetical protein